MALPAAAPRRAAIGTAVILALIVLAATTLRLVDLRHTPPGLHQDEAVNGWNAYCLLETGRDAFGAHWPIFYTRGIGENRSALYLYAVLPFQAILGPGVLATRLPNALAGIATVLLAYYIGRRLFDRRVGLVAAALLALNPWNLVESRWGHEAGFGLLLAMAPVALLLAANFPLDDDDSRRLRPWVALLAGGAAGVACYGYPAVRLFLPVFLIAAVAVTGRSWWARLRTRDGLLAILGLVAAGAVTFGPLLWQHVAHSDVVARRAEGLWAWDPSDSMLVRIGKVLARYPGHFGPSFLFLDGDRATNAASPGIGCLHYYELPLLFIGLVALLPRLRPSRAARVLGVWVLTYPAGDLLNSDLGMNSLRSYPGMFGLTLLAALGAVSAFDGLRRSRFLQYGAAAAFGAAALFVNVRFLSDYFGEYGRRTGVYFAFATDVIEACDWLRPKLDSYDAVYFTAKGTAFAYAITLVGLEYDPHRWFAEDRNVQAHHQWETVTRYGKIRFIYDDAETRRDLEELRRNGRPDRVLFVTRSDQDEPYGETPVHEILGPHGKKVVLALRESVL